MDSYSDFLTNNVITKIIVNVDGKIAREIITGQEFNIISNSNDGYGVCSLINITNNKKVLQIIADYLVINQNMELFSEKMRLVKNKKLPCSYR